jgi:hypothetical protein
VVVGRTDPLALGTWRSGPAWSTSKVPLALAALHRHDDTVTRERARRAITASDNDAAQALWASLGAAPEAAKAVDDELAAEGDRRTHIQWRQVRPPFSPFGQTEWSLDDQLTFTSGLACDRSRPSALVTSDMGSVTASQRWGLGRITHTRFKSGWGPNPSGRYLVRQIGLVPRGSQIVAVAIAVVPESGSFAQGTAALDQIASWLRASLPILPNALKAC